MRIYFLSVSVVNEYPKAVLVEYSSDLDARYDDAKVEMHAKISLISKLDFVR